MKFKSPLIINRINSHMLEVLCHGGKTVGPVEFVDQGGSLQRLWRESQIPDALCHKAKWESSPSGAGKEATERSKNQETGTSG